MISEKTLTPWWSVRNVVGCFILPGHWPNSFIHQSIKSTHSHSIQKDIPYHKNFPLDILHSEKVEQYNVWLGREHYGHLSPSRALLYFLPASPVLYMVLSFYWCHNRFLFLFIIFFCLSWAGEAAKQNWWTSDLFLTYVECPKGKLLTCWVTQLTSIKQGWCSTSWVHWRNYMVYFFKWFKIVHIP